MMKKITLLLFLLVLLKATYAKDTIKIGFDNHFPPYEFIDENGKASGFNIDLYKAIFEAYGYECVFIGAPWEYVYQLYQEGELDVLSIFYSKARSENYLLSVPHNYVTYSIFTHASQKKHTDVPEQYEKIIVIQDDIMHEYLKEMGVSKNRLIGVANAEEALKLLNNEPEFAAIVPKLQAFYFINLNELNNLIHVRESAYTKKYCFGVKPNNQKLLYNLNEGLAIAKEKGVYDELYSQWFWELKHPELSLFYTLKEYYPIVVAVVIFFLIIIFWNLFLKREVKRRHKELLNELHQRERSEMAIIESEERFRTLAQNSPAAIFIFNEKKIYFVNEAVSDLCGFDKETLMEMPVGAIFDDSHNAFFDELLQTKIHDSKYDRRHNLKIIHKDGTFKWVDIVFVKSYYKAEPVFIGTAFDTTSAKLYEKEILESRRIYSTLLSNLPGMAFRSMNNKEWTLLFVSEGCQNLTGYKREELLKNKVKSYADIIKDEDKQYVWESIQERIKKGQPYQVTYRIITKDENVKWVWEQGRLVQTEDSSYIEGYVVDVTESIEAKNKLNEERKQLETTLHSIGDGVISTDAQGRIVMMNPIAEKMTGWKSEEAKNKPLDEVFNIVNEYSREKCPNPVDKVLEHGQIVGLANHTALISKDGSEYIISDSAAPIKDEKGQITGVILVFSDNTENKKTQDDIIASELKLRATFNAIPDLIFRNNSEGFFTDFHAGENANLIIPREKIIGTHISSVFDKKFSESLVKTFNMCIQTGESQIAEYYLDFDDDRKFYEARIVKYDDNEILSLCRDITQRKLVEDKLTLNLKREQLLSEVSTIYNSNISFEEKIDTSFELLGHFFDVNRVYIMENYGDNNYCKNTYEWVSAPGLKEIDNLQNIDFAEIPTLYKDIKENKIFVVSSIENELEGEEKEVFTNQRIKAMIVIPIMVKGKFWGLIGFDDCDKERKWTSSEIEFLKTASNIVAAAIEKETDFELIQKEREQLEITLHSIGDGVIVSDTKGRITLINKIAQILTGYDSENAIGKPLEQVFNIVKESTGEKAVNPVEKVMETGRIVALENHTLLISKNNDKYVIADSAAPVKNKDGQIVGVVLVFRDDTEKRRSEDLIRQSEENYRKLFNFANDPIFIIENDVFVNCNERTTTVFGYAKEEIIGKSPAAFSPDYQPDGQKSQDKAMALIKKALNESHVYFEWEHQRKDGTLFTTEISLNKIDMNEKKCVLAIVRDISQRKKYERALQESEEKYKTLVEKANDGIAIIQDMNLIFVNTKLCAFTGYKEKDILNQSLLKFIDREYHEMVAEYNKARMNKEEGVQSIYEVNILHKSGKKMQAEINASYINFNEKPATLVVIRDIQERKEAEAKLNLFKATIENSTDAIGMSTPEGFHFYQNKAFDKLFGPYSSDIPDKIFPDNEIKQKVFSTIISGGLWEGEIEMLSCNGEILNILLRAYATLDKNGNVNGLVSIHTDITERKKAEEVLKTLLEINQMRDKDLQEISNYTLRKIKAISQSEIAFLAFTDSSQTPLKSYSLAEEKYVEKDVEKIMHEFYKNDENVFAKAMETNAPIVINNYAGNTQNETLPEEHKGLERVIIVPIIDDGHIRILATLVNKKTDYNENDKHQITIVLDRLWKTIQSKRHNESIKKLNEHLIEKNKEMEQFVYVTSHDLRSPLVNIQGFTKELMNASEEIKMVVEQNNDIVDLRNSIRKIYDEDVTEALGYIELSAKKMDVLLNGLLKLSRMGRVTPSKKQIDFSELFNDIIKSFEFQLKNKNINIIINTPHNCCADETLINQAISNIIDNAIKYIDHDKGLISVKNYIQENRLVLSIEDNGPGIPEKYHKKIFEIFNRLDDKVEGEGLGLSIVQKIIEKHNGKIWVESNEGEGAKFFISLPIENI